MASKPLKCRLGQHDWQRKMNEEDRTPYFECARCKEIKDSVATRVHGGAAGA